MQGLHKSKKIQLAVVLLLVASIIVTGTYAWSGFFGKANTDTPAIIPEEVMLVDFSSQFGEIYVVNNTGDDMLVRIRLVQNLRAGGKQLIPGTLADDPSTWPADDEQIKKYFRPVFSTAVIPMEQWIEDGSPVGDYWVADTNGWYYYAKRLAAGEATRTLITEVAVNQFSELVDPDYQTATFLQSVTRGELGDLLALDSTSFSSNGKLLMKYISGELVEFVKNKTNGE